MNLWGRPRGKQCYFWGNLGNFLGSLQWGKMKFGGLAERRWTYIYFVGERRQGQRLISS